MLSRKVTKLQRCVVTKIHVLDIIMPYRFLFLISFYAHIRIYIRDYFRTMYNNSRFFLEDTNVCIARNLVNDWLFKIFIFRCCIFRLATTKSNVKFSMFNRRAQTLERSGCGGLGAVGQAAIAIALGADGELQRGWRDAGLPLGGGILPESSPGECKHTFVRFTLQTKLEREDAQRTIRINDYKKFFFLFIFFFAIKILLSSIFSCNFFVFH